MNTTINIEKKMVALESCVSTGEKARKNMCVTEHYNINLAVKVLLNRKIINQLSYRD